MNTYYLLAKFSLVCLYNIVIINMFDTFGF